MIKPSRTNRKDKDKIYGAWILVMRIAFMQAPFAQMHLAEARHVLATLEYG